MKAWLKRRSIDANPAVDIISAMIIAIKLLVFMVNHSFPMVYSVGAPPPISKRNG